MISRGDTVRLLFALALASVEEVASARLSDRPEPERPKRPLPAPEMPVPEFVLCWGVDGAEP